MAQDALGGKILSRFLQADRKPIESLRANGSAKIGHIE
jgi:hypothetical protein